MDDRMNQYINVKILICSRMKIAIIGYERWYIEGLIIDEFMDR